MARATTYDITQGEEVGLIVKGCSSDIVWRDEKLATVSINKIWLNTPTSSQTYAVYCKNSSGEACAFQLPTINVKCELKLIQNDLESHHNWGAPVGSVMVTALGCPADGRIEWEVNKGNRNIDGEAIGLNQYKISDIRRNFSATIKATCFIGNENCSSTELSISRPVQVCGYYASAKPITLSLKNDKIEIKALSSANNNGYYAYADAIKWLNDKSEQSLSGEQYILKYFDIPKTKTLFEAIVIVRDAYDELHECPVAIPFEPQNSNSKNTPIIPPTECTPFVASASKTNFDCDDKIQLSSKWCGVTETNTGVVTWDPAIPLNGIVTPTAQEITYKATCQFNGQTIISEVKLTKKTPKVFVYLSQESFSKLYYNNILAGTTINLESSGCYDDKCTKGIVKYFVQYYPLANGSGTGFKPMNGASLKIDGSYQAVEFKVVCDANKGEGLTKKWDILVPNPCDFNVIVDQAHSNPPIVTGGLANITITGCDLGTISWRNSNGGSGNITSNKRIDDNATGSITYKIACNMNGKGAILPFCEKEVIIYRPEPKPVIKDNTQCADFFQGSYEYKLGMASAIGTSSNPTYTPKEKAIYAGIDDFSTKGALLRLASANCPSNVVTWYDNKGTKISDKNIISIQFPDTSPAVYTSECTITLNNNKTIKCTSDVTVHFDPDYIKELNRILANERIAIQQSNVINEVSQDNVVSQPNEATASNCGFMTTQKAVGDILKNLICDNGKLFIEAPITTEKVETLKKTILENPMFQDKGISLPPITDAMFVDITAGGAQCQTAIDGLVKDVVGISLKEDFNTLVTDPDLIDELTTDVLKKIKLNENDKCLSIGVIISALKLEILGQTNLKLYDLPTACVNTTEADVQAETPSSSVNLGKISLSMSKSFIGNGVVLKEKALYAEGDAGNPKKVNIVLGDTPAMIFEFTSQAMADRVLDWMGGGKKVPNNGIFDVSAYKPTRSVLEFVSETEAKIPYVYDDADNSRPRKNYCETGGKIEGNLTVGIGKIIENPAAKRSDGKTNLEYWCERSPLTDDEMWEIFENGDFKEHVQRMKNKFTKPNVKYNQCQWDALASVIYNRGSYGTGNDYWEKNIADGEVKIPKENPDIKEAFISAFTNRDKKWFKGLMCRRIAESQMFINCSYEKLSTKECNDECELNNECK
ncbi:hypothetical protein [Emticicia sp. 17c]|uniref:hypothetical protein n=1 Tax=Emticicia sp. 17c TaxID=3127704 RepID=UPI00301BC391